MEEYKQKVEFYFQAEYSDLPIIEVIKKMVELKNYRSKNWWENKIDKLISVYHKDNKHQAEAARHIAKLFKPAFKSLLSK